MPRKCTHCSTNKTTLDLREAGKGAGMFVVPFAVILFRYASLVGKGVVDHQPYFDDEIYSSSNALVNITSQSFAFLATLLGASIVALIVNNRSRQPARDVTVAAVATALLLGAVTSYFAHFPLIPRIV